MRRPSGSGIAAAACAAVALALLLAGCGGALDRRPLVVAFDDVPATFDPHRHNESVVWSVLSNFYDALVSTGADMRLEPALAASWRQLGPTEWRLELREGVRFSDGATFSSADVVASFHRAATHPRSGIRHLLAGIAEMRGDGEHAVTIATREPVPDLLNRLAFLFIVPSREADTEEIATPIGTGPYRFVRRSEDGSVEARAWRSWRGAAAIGRVRLEFFAGTRSAALERLLAGGIDVLSTVKDDDLPRIEGRPGVRIEPQPRLAVNLLAVASRAAPGDAGRALADPRVRRAMLLALNRQSWVGRVYRGNATVAGQYVHPVVFGYDPSVQPLPYDPEEARRLMAASGFAEGFDVQLGHGEGLPQVIAAIREDLARINVRVRPHEAPFSELIRLARTGEVPLFYYAWACTTGDASDFLNSSLHTRDEALGLGAENFTGFSDAKVDALLVAAESEMAPVLRLELLQRAQRMALEALPVLPLTVRWSFVGVSDRVEVVTRHDSRLWVAGWRWRR